MERFWNLYTVWYQRNGQKGKCSERTWLFDFIAESNNFVWRLFDMLQQAEYSWQHNLSIRNKFGQVPSYFFFINRFLSTLFNFYTLIINLEKLHEKVLTEWFMHRFFSFTFQLFLLYFSIANTLTSILFFTFFFSSSFLTFSQMRLMKTSVLKIRFFGYFFSKVKYFASCWIFYFRCL